MQCKKREPGYIRALQVRSGSTASENVRGFTTFAKDLLRRSLQAGTANHLKLSSFTFVFLSDAHSDNRLGNYEVVFVNVVSGHSVVEFSANYGNNTSTFLGKRFAATQA